VKIAPRKGGSVSLVVYEAAAPAATFFGGNAAGDGTIVIIEHWFSTASFVLQRAGFSNLVRRKK
jgi:hypothetical protein